MGSFAPTPLVLVAACGLSTASFGDKTCELDNACRTAAGVEEVDCATYQVADDCDFDVDKAKACIEEMEAATCNTEFGFRVLSEEGIAACGTVCVRDLDLEDIPVLRVLNKVDLVPDGHIHDLARRFDAVAVSAEQRVGFTELIAAAEERLGMRLRQRGRYSPAKSTQLQGS